MLPMAQDQELKELEESIRKTRATRVPRMSHRTMYQPKKENNDLRSFFLGLILLGVGLYWLFQRTVVSTGGLFGMYGISFGSFSVPSGTVILPFFIGVVMLFFMRRKIFGWIVMALGLAIVVLAIAMSVRIHLVNTSMFDYVMMFGCMGAGSGLLLRVMFKPRKDDE